MKKRWSKQKVWDWYDKQPWLVGCNYVPSNSINLIETWQEYNFETMLADMEQELSLASSIGMNTVRMLLPFDVWRYQRKGFLIRFEQFLEVLGSKNMTLMPIFFDDCGRSDQYPKRSRTGHR
ncbi:hypothetical protein [Anaerocolumna sp. MB42-C2]|uniref:hypothetical protein n=1 Tax=Anaerocolumna sp. MB42-C2 TaxID=3070997 RepID=UPI0027E062C4|nr:hypothetical protein [Anaerocolumna sp. MB42-C2]WMJ89210.1 hypothetical protein RBU59_06700 [Anaerocolumna sp. MB42-C2]